MSNENTSHIVSNALNTDVANIICPKNNFADTGKISLEDHLDEITRLNRVIEILVCRNEYLTEGLMQHKFGLKAV